MSQAASHPIDQGDTRRRADRSVSRWLAANTGAMLAFSSAVCGPLGWFALSRLHRVAADLDVAIGGAALWCLTHRAWIMVAAAIAVGAGILGACHRRGRWWWLGLSSICLAGLAIVVVYCLVAVLAPLYTVTDLG